MSGSGTKSVPNNTHTIIDFDTVEASTDSGEALASDEFIVPVGKGGLWHLSSVFTLEGSITPNRRVVLILRVNGADAHVVYNCTSSVFCGAFLDAVINVTEGDALTVTVYQTTGSTLSFRAGTTYNRFSGRLLG